MHDDRFDALTRMLWEGETRRRLMRRFALVPVIGTIMALVLDDDEAVAEHPVRRVQRRRARRRAQRRRRLHRQRRRCAHPCGACQRCRRGSCRATTDGARCGNGGECRGGSCVCPGSQVLCGGKCVNTNTDPLNCGRCGNRCLINGICDQGRCICAGCPDSPWQCCPAGGTFCSLCGDDEYGDPLTCEFIPEEECPPERRCVGTNYLCSTCCPPGTTCDTTAGTCLR